MQQDQFSAVAWRDKKIVTLLATNTDPTEVGTVHRKQSDGRREEIQCPSAFVSYNKHMKVVDRGNQHRMCYLCRTKCRKFYKYPFWFCIDVAITNSLALHKEVNLSPMSTAAGRRSYRGLPNKTSCRAKTNITIKASSSAILSPEDC